MMMKNKEKIMLDNHTRAIMHLADSVGQIIDYLRKKDDNFNIKEGALLDEKTNDKNS